MLKIMTIFSLLFSPSFHILGGSYIYSYWGDALHSAPGMSFVQSVDSESLGTTLLSPEDLVIHNDIIYLVDSDANSVLVMNNDFELQHILSEFYLTEDYLNSLDPFLLNETIILEYSCPIEYELEIAQGTGEVSCVDPNTSEEVPGVLIETPKETLNDPHGIDVTDSGIFIADTRNNRIVILNHDFEVVSVVENIEDDTFDEVAFEPTKITVDSTNRMYVVAKNVFEGILEINDDGTFNRFTGVNPIQLTPLEIFTRSLMTEEQIAKLPLFLPTEYTNVTINDRNFIYATSKVSDNNDNNPVQLINPKGLDVIKANGYFPIKGDIYYVGGSSNQYVETGPSSLVDIAYTNDGIFTVLDQKRSRLFTYDSEGSLLFIDGSEGSQVDKFTDGVAIAYLNDKLLVLDRGTKTIVVYQPTEFGSLVRQAISFHNQGLYEEAALVWEEVIKLNTNYEIAYNGIGKLKLRQGEFEEAMYYFQQGHDQYYYSKAFKEYRNEMIRDNFGFIFGGVIILTGALFTRKIIKTKREGGSMLYED